MSVFVVFRVKEKPVRSSRRLVILPITTIQREVTLTKLWKLELPRMTSY